MMDVVIALVIAVLSGIVVGRHLSRRGGDYPPVASWRPPDEIEQERRTRAAIERCLASRHVAIESRRPTVIGRNRQTEEVCLAWPNGSIEWMPLVTMHAREISPKNWVDFR